MASLVRTFAAAFERFVACRRLGFASPASVAAILLDATLAASDLVFVAPLYGYGIPASFKLYLDHWSGWKGLPVHDFRERMAGKTAWAISSYSDSDTRRAEHLHMHWGGRIFGEGNRPGDVLGDAAALERPQKLFTIGSYVYFDGFKRPCKNSMLCVPFCTCFFSANHFALQGRSNVRRCRERSRTTNGPTAILRRDRRAAPQRGTRTDAAAAWRRCDAG